MTDGGELISRIEELERDVKILLRAQVIQGDTQRVDGDRIARLEKLMEQSMARQDYLDQRVDRLVSAIGELIAQMRGNRNS